jgi:hypothetical protein
MTKQNDPILTPTHNDNGRHAPLSPRRAASTATALAAFKRSTPHHPAVQCPLMQFRAERVAFGRSGNEPSQAQQPVGGQPCLFMWGGVG